MLTSITAEALRLVMMQWLMAGTSMHPIEARGCLVGGGWRKGDVVVAGCGYL